MHEKDLGVTEYLDLYGDILDDRQKQIIEMYYNEDYSLSEISEITGITRQGVGESVRKSVRRLYELEDKLHFKKRIESFEKSRDELAEKITNYIKDIKDGVVSSELYDILNELQKLSIGDSDEYK